MAQVEFQYNDISAIIQCNEEQKMEEICNNFISKLNLNENNLSFVYNGSNGKNFDKKLTFNQMANSFDKERKKMNILVISNNNIDNNNIDKTKNYNDINQISINEIKLTVKIEEDDINKKIYFLDNTDDNIVVEFKLNEKSLIGYNDIREEHHHDFLKELNESNTELYINNEKYKFEKYFIPEKEGEYNILLKFNFLLTDCNFMFYNCFKITKIDYLYLIPKVLLI